MNTTELQDLLTAPKPPLLLMVLPEEIFEAGHIPGSVNACVYEMAFLDTVRALASHKDHPIVVYGAGEGSLDSDTALAKLGTDGYSDVRTFTGGMAAWKAAGLPLNGTGQFPAAPEIDGRYQVDTQESVIRWTGRNLFNHHHGTVQLASGEMVVQSGRLVSACFTIDMATIACDDLADPGWNAMLIRHLHDADFFDIARHPVAECTIDTVTEIQGATEGTPNHQLHGDFTLRGTTQPIEFPAVIATVDGSRITGQAQLEIDRTQYGSLYGSGKFFRFLGRHVVNDHIQLHVKLHADRC